MTLSLIADTYLEGKNIFKYDVLGGLYETSIDYTIINVGTTFYPPVRYNTIMLISIHYICIKNAL